MPGRTGTAPGAGYRFGFSGQECDNEIAGIDNIYAYDYRLFDSRLGKWLSVEPLSSYFPMHSPYAYAANNPILFVDYDGRYFGIDDALAGLIGGGVNLGIALYRGNVKNFGQGLAYFGAGASAGVLALYPEFGGWAAGGAIVAGTDAAIDDYNRTGSISLGHVAKDAAIGGVFGQVGGFVFSKAAPYVAKYTGPIIARVTSFFVNKQGKTVAATIELGVPEITFEFSHVELNLVGEVNQILSSSELNVLQNAYNKGIPASIKIGNKTILYEPDIPASTGISAMTLTHDGLNGFVLSGRAFSSPEEFTKTLLQEVYRLDQSIVAKTGSANAQTAAETTQKAFNFAEKAFDRFFKK